MDKQKSDGCEDDKRKENRLPRHPFSLSNAFVTVLHSFSLLLSACFLCVLCEHSAILDLTQKRYFMQSVTKAYS